MEKVEYSRATRSWRGRISCRVEIELSAGRRRMVCPFPPSVTFKRTTLPRHVQFTVRVSMAQDQNSHPVIARNETPSTNSLPRCSRRLRRHLELEAECAHHFEHSGELRIPVRGKRLVQAFSTETSRTRDLRHALGARDYSEGMGHQSRITVLQNGFKIIGNVGVGLQICSGIPQYGLHFCPGCTSVRSHSVLLEIAGQFVRQDDISWLRALIAAGEQDNRRDSALNEIHSISRPVIDSHLQDALADRPHVARIADL